MNIKELYDKNEQINIETYLSKCGVKDIEEYLNPSGKYLDDCMLYNNIRDGVQEIKYHCLTENNKIFIIQDGDCDGVCCTVMLYQYLRALKEDLDISILIHTSKQRGLDDEDIMNRIREEKPNLVIIPDAGTNNKIQAKELCDLGIGLLVIDHHDIATPIEHGTLINNQDPKSNVSKNGSGALVTHKFLQALDKEFNLEWSSWFIDLVALSLISDSMDMSEMENREYYHYGLETIECVNNEFLKHLIDSFIGNEYTQKDLSFKVIPKINSICRHKNIEYKQRLIMAFIGQDNLDEVLDIVSQAHKDQIDTVNNIIELNVDKIEEIKDNNLIVFASDDIPRSYSGLVCAKIMNICNNKPTIVGSIKDGEFIGSLRSPIPLRSDLDNNDLVEWASGHEDSCGILIKENNIGSLVDYYNSLTLSYSPCISVLKSYTVKSIPTKLFGLFEPYNALWNGKGLQKPMFHISNITFNPSDVQIMGKTKRVIKIHSNGIDFMIFNCLKEDKEKLGLGYYEDGCFISSPKKEKMQLECVGELGINEWNGNKKLQVIIDKYEIMCYNKKSKKDIF